MREAGKILAYFAAVVVGGCLLAPPLFWAGRALADAGIAPFLGQFEFPRYFNRAVLIVALGLLWPLLAWLGVRRFEDLDLDRNPQRFRHLGVGLGIALGGLTLVAILLIAIGRFKLRKKWGLEPIGMRVFSAFVVAIIEETFFRGALLGVLRRHLSWQKALAFNSVFFAAVHFIRPPKQFPPILEVEWTSGFTLVPDLLWQFGNPRLLVGGLVTLVLVGVILGYSVIRTRSLYLAIGLHAGWVMGLRTFDYLTRRKLKSSMWFGKDLMTGLGPVLMLTVTFVIVALVVRRMTATTPREASS